VKRAALLLFACASCRFGFVDHDVNGDAHSDDANGDGQPQSSGLGTGALVPAFPELVESLE
jgi:hypothetical protein